MLIIHLDNLITHNLQGDVLDIILLSGLKINVYPENMNNKCFLTRYLRRQVKALHGANSIQNDSAVWNPLIM